MKYASEVIDLMGCMPGRRFKMREIIRHVNPDANARERAVIRTGVWRVLQQLEATGHIETTRDGLSNGAHAEYWWKSITSEFEKHSRNHYIISKPQCAYRF